MSDELDQILSEDKKTEAPKEIQPGLPKLPGTNTLRGIASTILVLGIIGSIIIWINMSTSEVKSFSGYSYDRSTVVNPSGIVTGFLVFFSSMLFWGISIVVCTIADYVIAINHKLEKLLQKKD